VGVEDLPEEVTAPALQPGVLAAIAGAGAVGALARHLATTGVLALWPAMPMPSAIVNVLGCAGFGVCFALAHERWPAAASAAVLVGFFGGFTTFSSFALEGHLLAAGRRWGLLALELIAQNALGLLAIAGGLAVGARLRAG
jgi:CrcB protein